VGFGLVIAVLGIGSTFAANIQINNNANIEFGRGFTQTVFCGGEQEVTIAPISTYVDPVLAAPKDSFRARFATSYFTTRPGDFTPYDGTPSTVNGITGWWVTAPDRSILASNQSLVAVRATTAPWIFSERQQDGGAGPYGYFKVNDREFREVVITPAVETGFRVGGVIISDIPPECDDHVFVLSFFGETGTAQTMISNLTSTAGEEVKEVAYNWYSVDGTAYTVSSSRTSFVGTPLVTAATTPDSLKFIFNLGGATAIEADALDKIVIETQPDSFD
jgi:hypothetical protein